MADEDNVTERLPTSDIEAKALRPVIVALLRTIPATWTESDVDRLTDLQSNALFLLIAAGMVERRGWIRTTIANHRTCFEIRFQATGEGGFEKALKKAAAVEYQEWSGAWRTWNEGEMKGRSPFLAQALKPQELRLTAQGEIARDELSGAVSEAEMLTVVDFVLKCGLYGPGYWFHRALFKGQSLSPSDQRLIERQFGAGRDIAELSRPPVGGSGELLEIRKIEQPAASQAVSLVNWNEGASAFANSFGKMLGPMFEALSKGHQVASAETIADKIELDSTVPASDSLQAPVPFRGGEMKFLPDRVTFCGVDICRGPRSGSRREVLELLAMKRVDGSFVAYSGEDLEAKALERGAKGTAARWIQDLRLGIKEVLRNEVNIACGDTDVILSGGPGYRFSELVSVQFGEPPPITDIMDMEGCSDVRNGDVRDVRDDEAAERRTWILHQLATGARLKAPHVADQFKRSGKTAQRDLDTLREEKLIEFVGDPRTGYYQLCKPPKAQ